MSTTRPTPGQASDPALLKLTNHYVRQHRFVATSLTTFTTSERRGFERDVHDYARGVGLSKNQAKKEVIKARSFCGEIDYDSDVSALDGEINDQIQIIQKLVLPSSAPSEAKEHIRIRDAETPIPGEAPIEAVIAQTESYRIKLQSNRQTQVKKHEERKREGHVPVPQSKENLGGAGRVYAAMPHQGFTSGFGSLDQNEGPSEDRQFGNGKRTKKPNETTAVLGDQGVITDTPNRPVKEATPPYLDSNRALEPSGTLEHQQVKPTDITVAKPALGGDVTEERYHEAPETEHASMKVSVNPRKGHCRKGRQRQNRWKHNRADQSHPDLRQPQESETYSSTSLSQDDSQLSKKRKASSVEKEQGVDTDNVQNGVTGLSPGDSRIALPGEGRNKRPKGEDQAVIDHEIVTEQTEGESFREAARRSANRWMEVAKTSKKQASKANAMDQQPTEFADAEDLDNPGGNFEALEAEYAAREHTPDPQSLPATAGADTIGSRQKFPKETCNNAAIKLEALDEIDSKPSVGDGILRCKDYFSALLDQEGDPNSSSCSVPDLRSERYTSDEGPAADVEDLDPLPESVTVRSEQYSGLNHEALSYPATQTPSRQPKHKNGHGIFEDPLQMATGIAKVSKISDNPTKIANNNNRSSQGHFNTVLDGALGDKSSRTAIANHAVRERSFASIIPIQVPIPIPITELNSSNTLAASLLHLNSLSEIPQTIRSGSLENPSQIFPGTPQKPTTAKDSTCSSPLSSLSSTPDYSPPPASRYPTDTDNLDSEAYLSHSPLPPLKSPTKQPTPRRPTTKSTSHYFPNPKQARPGRRKVSVIPFPPLSSTSFGLFQERLYAEPFWLFVAVHFLNKTKGIVALPAFYDLVAAFPTPEALAAATKQQVLPFFARLGLQNRRTSAVISFARTWLERPPEKGKRYRKLNYPCKGDGKDITPAEEPISDDDPRAAWEVVHLPTVGAYALDSWRIFCRDRLRHPTNVNTTNEPPILEDAWNGQTARRSDLTAEWTKVVPTDKELRAYLKWRWMRLGWDWDWNTGEKRELSNWEWVGGTHGGITIEEGYLGKVEIRGEKCPMVKVESIEGSN